MDYITDYYNKYREDERLTTKSHLPDYLTTMKYIEEYLKPDSKIIEIGAGTGRYSLTLAEKGYDVTAVELVEHNIEIMRSKIKENMNLKTYQGNACDLDFIESKKYDIVLLLGPVYHLFTIAACTARKVLKGFSDCCSGFKVYLKACYFLVGIDCNIAYISVDKRSVDFLTVNVLFRRFQYGFDFGKFFFHLSLGF